MSALKRKASGSGPLAFDEAQCRRALAALADPDHGCEVMGLPCARHLIAPGREIDKLTAFARDLAAGGNQVYLVLNPVPPDLARAALKDHVLHRRWLFIDVDPQKPQTHKDDSATQAEKDGAELTAAQILQELQACGWHVPVEIDSGNGRYLIYRTDLPNNAPSQQIVRAFLRALAGKYSGEAGLIDTAVHNANRLAKLPGSLAAKGPNTPERPHRPCRLVHLPTALVAITAEQIVAATEKLIGKAAVPGVEDVPSEPAGTPEPPSSATPPAPASPASRLRLRVPDEDPAVAAYGRAALEAEAEAVATATRGPTQGGNNQLNTSAFKLGQLVAGGVLDRSEVEDCLRDAARKVGLYADDGERSVEATLRSGIEAGMNQPRGVPERPELMADGTYALATEGAADSISAHSGASTDAQSDAKSDAKPNPTSDDQSDAPFQFVIDGEIVLEEPEEEFLRFDSDQLRRRGGGRQIVTHTMAELMSLDMPEPQWVIPGILSEGLNILAGKPKMGKSMMALNLAMTIAAGGRALGDIRTVSGDVLYLSLEDNARRVQSRAKKMCRGLEVEASRRLTIATQWPNQGRGGLRLIDHWAVRSERPVLVIIDVWGRFKPPHIAKGNAYEQDYAQLATLKTFVESRNCHALILLHCRKMASDDVLEEISGTMGLSGAADGIIVLHRTRNSQDAEIFVTGRDVQEAKLSLEFDKDTLCWKSLGPSEQVVTGKLQLKILTYLRGMAGQVTHTKQIADAIESTPDCVRRILHRLRERGLVRQHGHGWIYPGPAETGTVDPDTAEF